MPSDTAAPIATVAILTFNGEHYLEELLDAVAAQQVEGGVETLVIDSGSSDRTVEIVKARPGVRLIEIPNSEFSHGRTRALAVREARGRYVAMLTQDATPADAHWLAELIAPFAVDDRIALVTGRQAPRPHAFPLQKYEIVGTFDKLGPRRGIVIHRPEDAAADGTFAFHSDVNAAVRRELALERIPFRDVPYAEDQLMAKDVFDAGLWKAYAGAAAVIHSNDLTLAEYGPRIFDETVGLRRIGFQMGALSTRDRWKLTLRGIAGDSVRIARDRGMSRRDRALWLLRNPRFHVAKWRHHQRATSIDLDDAAAFERGSLEAGRRRSQLVDRTDNQ